MRSFRLLATVAFSVFVGNAALAETPQSGLQIGDLPPQVLGLVANAHPIPMQCDGGVCQTLVSSFCLQQDRPQPSAGQGYEIAGAGDVTLVVTEEGGKVREFSGIGLLSYESDGHFTRTRIKMGAERLKSLKAKEVAVRVSPMVSLLPVTENELTAEMKERDMDTALGSPRFLAEGFFAPGKARSDTAVTVTRMINMLPVVGGSAKPDARRSIWDRVRQPGATSGLSEGGVQRAKDMLDRCGQFADMGIKLTLRGCLSTSHDKLMREVNDELWEAQPGY